MIDLVAFGIIIDDLVFPDGHTAMGVLGGGGPQTAFGMRLPALAGWSKETNVGLVAGVGRDLPDSAKAWLESASIDLTGTRVSDLPTPRAWQLMEMDGRRTQVWRVKGEVISVQLGRTLIPPSYRQAKGFHLGIHPDEPNLEFIQYLRTMRPQTDHRPPIVSIELFRPAERPPSDSALRSLCSAADIFSPNLVEAQSLVGEGAPDEMARRLAEAGAHIVALRMEADGSLVYDGLHLYHTPAAPATTVDPTGAGNAFCGGFLAGYIQTDDAPTAARYGAVAASLVIEQIGLPPINDELREKARRRMAKDEG